MIVTDLADLAGARGPGLRWERVLLFTLALVLADASYTLLVPLFASGDARAALAVLVSLSTAVQLAVGVVRSLFLAALVVLLLRFVPDVLTALLAVAAVHAVFSRGLFVLTLVAQGVRAGSDPALAFLDPLGLALAGAWALLFFGGLEVALRAIPALIPALVAGALGGQLAVALLRVALIVVLHRGGDVGGVLRFAPLSLVHAAVFVTVLGGGLLAFSARPSPGRA